YRGGLFPKNASPCEVGGPYGTVLVGDACLEPKLTTFSSSGYSDQDEVDAHKAAAFAACAKNGRRAATLEGLSAMCSSHPSKRCWNASDGFWLNGWSSKSAGSVCAIDKSTDDAVGLGYHKVLCARTP